MNNFISKMISAGQIRGGKILGYLLLISFTLILISSIALVVGITQTIMVAGISLILTAMVVVGIMLVF